jgi:hypothetical protein
MIDVHSYAPLQGPSALVHIDLFRIYMAYNISSDPLKMIQANVDLNWPSIFREEDLFIKV